MVSGLLLVDKPIGVTSHAVVGMVKRSLRPAGGPKVGHLGTLDPFASGVLPIMVGGLTRLADELHAGTKRYLFRIQFGAETDTLDLTGRVVDSAPVPRLDRQSIEAALKPFRGQILQIPPAYSALKHQGRPLYEYMRTQGKLGFDLADRARQVTLFSLEDQSTELDYARGTALLHVTCSKGTYVRSLCRDIARALGTLGHCTELRRTAVGVWAEKDTLALQPENLRQADQLTAFLIKHLISPLDVMPALPHLVIPSDHMACARADAGNRIDLTLSEAAAWSKRTGETLVPAAAEGMRQGTPVFLSTARQLFLARLEWVGAEGHEPIARIQPEKRVDTFDSRNDKGAKTSTEPQSLLLEHADSTWPANGP